MRKLTALVMAVGLMAVCFSQAASRPLSRAFVAVNITVLPYAKLNIFEDELVMNPVTADMFEAGMSGEERQSLASTWLEVTTNTSVRLKAPLTVTLSNNGSYQAEVDVSLSGENVNYTQDSSFQYIDLGISSHNLTLHVKIDKVWTMADTAGTYTGTITLNIYIP